MKCQIQWIDENGKPTPDENEAVAMAHAHEAKWLLPSGGIANRIVGYTNEIRQSIPICGEHLKQAEQARLDMRNGWTFTPLPDLGGCVRCGARSQATHLVRVANGSQDAVCDGCDPEKTVEQWVEELK